MITLWHSFAARLSLSDSVAPIPTSAELLQPRIVLATVHRYRYFGLREYQRLWIEYRMPSEFTNVPLVW